jgi:hypothetical protein
MPEKTAAEYASSYTFTPAESDFYSAELTAFEFLDGEGKFGADGKPMGDSYKLIWDIPDIDEPSFWDFVSARVGIKKTDGTKFPLQAVIDGLVGKDVDTTQAPYATMTPGMILQKLLGKSMDLYIEPIQDKKGIMRNKITKRRASKTTKTSKADTLETTNIPPEAPAQTASVEF